MKNVSIIALLSAGLFAAAAAIALAQDVSVGVSTEISGEVSVSTPDVSSALSSITSELSSAVSSAEGEVSSQLSSVLSSAMSSEEGGGMGSQEPMNCGSGQNDLDISAMSVGMIDAASLAAVTSVSVITVADCSGLAQIDGNAQATLAAHPAVIDALAKAGETGAEVVAYSLDGASLTVFVRMR